MTIDNRQVLASLVDAKLKTGTTTDILRGELRNLGFEDKDINNAIQAYIQEFKSKNSDQTLTGKPEPQEPWFTGPNLSEGSHWNKLCGVLTKDKNWADEMIGSLNESSNSVVGKLANPQSLGTLQVKGLVLGYVQSGKTANYSAVITKALDAGYKFIIVLSGIHNNLRYQTETRLRQEIVGPSDEKADPITRMEKDGDFNGKIAQSANRALGSTDGFGIAVLKKNVSVLRKFNKWISDARPEVLSDCKVLIIDDESDQASINTSKKPELNSTAINRQIKDIIAKFRLVSYVGYTATPFANILIDASIGDDLFPKDFMVSLKKPVSYIGAEEIFGSINSDGEYNEGYPLVKSINAIDEIDEYEDEDDEVPELSTSMKLAIDYFILAGALRLSRGQRNHISMLFHSSHLIAEQTALHGLIEDYVRDRQVAIKRSTDEELEFYKNLYLSEIKEITKELKIAEDKLKDHELVDNLKLFLEKFEIILDNSSSDKRLSFETSFWGIVVGGNTLSRGLTIEGLTVSYFVRSTQMYDSLMQMGRWFGYRPRYLDLKRVFITDEVRDKFIQMASVENEIREEIAIMAENNDRPIDFKIRVRQHPGMSITARNKMQTARTESSSFAGRRGLPDFLNLFNDKIAIQNLTATKLLLSKLHETKCKSAEKHFSMFRSSHVFRGCPKELILQFLSDYHISPANNLANKSDLISYIESNKNLTDWSVSIISLLSGQDEYQFSTGEKVKLLDRSYVQDVHKGIDPEAHYVRGLYLPKDEMIDLADLYESDDISKALTDEKGEHIGCSRIRNKVRPKNRALLAIYPLSPDSKSEERQAGTYYLKPIKTSQIQIGLMLVFPDSDEYRVGDYIVNDSI